MNHFTNYKSINQVLLATAIVKVRDYYGKEHLCRALIDSGSQASLITEACVQRLGLKRTKSNVAIVGIAQSGTGCCRGSTQVHLASITTDFAIEVNALIMTKLTGLIPNTQVNVEGWSGIQNLNLADPDFYRPSKIDIILGADVFTELLMEGNIIAGKNQPSAYNTQLGWVLSGNVQHTNPVVARVHLTRLDVQDQLKQFWEIEEVEKKVFLTKEEQECESHFISNHKRDSNGRYCVSLPIKQDGKILGSSRDMAIKRWNCIERRLEHFPLQKQQYNDFLQEYLDLGHMEPVSPNELQQEKTVYLPHHFVLKESSTSTALRVVFDASAKTTSGVSLNDKLMVGNKLQDDIWDIILRFRLHMYAFTADIEKMYRQVNIEKQDSNFQRIIWRPTNTEGVVDFRLKTVTYGTASAPFLAVRALQQLAHDESVQFPLAKEIVLRDFYIDDLISGANSIPEGLEIQCELIAMLKQGGFQLKKWSSNSNDLLKSLPGDYIETKFPLSMESDDAIKTLGVLWHPGGDYFSFKVTLTDINVWNKRRILSDVARLYDPLGWLAPVVIKAKILLQRIWISGVSWDEALPPELESDWLKFRDSLFRLQEIKLHRWINTDQHSLHQLHGFCDASESAYGAVVYLRSEDINGTISVHLLSAKTRVAPIKQVSLPRLELCGAVLLAKLLKRVKASLNIQFDSIHAWTDSTVTLAWIHGCPRRWKTFVANRVSEIQDSISPEWWHHVPSSVNPADVASRGIFPPELLNDNLWWNGPIWLCSESTEWPNNPSSYTEISEERQTIKTHVVAVFPKWELLPRYSSVSKLKRVTAYCLRFIMNCRLSKDNRVFSQLSVRELQQALLVSVKSVQAEEFMGILQNKETKNSHIASLNPFLDESGVIRVGGRLRHAQLNYDQRFPILLPKQHHLTNLIINDIHIKHLHAGPQATLAILQHNFWVVNGRSAVRQILFKCHKCFRDRTVTLQQQMGDIPAHRLEPVRPFLRCGVDFAGPISIKSSKLRNAKILKAYIALFVCFTTKAVHLEIVSELSSSAFIAALRRFIARRGKCADIYSDNATNFTGTNTELKKLYEQFQSEEHIETIGNFLSTEGINWHFIPARAPHFGGLWEAGIKSVKTHLRRVVGVAALTFEELYTVSAQIEACLNSRPLCPVSSDPSDLSVLTPGHFLIGDSLTAIAEPSLTHLKINTLDRWQLIQQLVQHFWKRWQGEYLSSLQQRPKWKNKQDVLKVGDLVLIKEDNIPPCLWVKGRIVETFPGKDNLVRVVNVKTAVGVYKRPIVKLSLLPM